MYWEPRAAWWRMCSLWLHVLPNDLQHPLVWGPAVCIGGEACNTFSFYFYFFIPSLSPPVSLLQNFLFSQLTGEQVAKLSFHDCAVRDVSWHPHRPQIASVSWDGRVALWHHLHGERPTADEGSLKPVPECLLDDRDDMFDDY